MVTDRKICTTCKKLKFLNDFHKHKLHKDGLSSNCKICRITSSKESYNKRRKKILVQKAEYRKTESWKENKRKWGKKKYKEDSNFKIKTKFSNSINKSLGRGKGGHWEDIVGYTLQELKEHLEAQFKPWMNWSNHGNYDKNQKTWQIDHIKPISSFIFTNTNDLEFKKCWSLDNLKPLESIKNLKKWKFYGNVA